MEAVFMCVLSHGSRSGVAVEVEKGYPRAFNHHGSWYVWERDLEAGEFYRLSQK